MARSNTMPIQSEKGYEASMRSKKLDRSNTVQAPPATKHHLPLHIPHPHNPFHKTENNITPTSSHAPKPRPGLPTRQNSVQTRYMNMLLDLDTIPRLHNIYASFFTWILLAGFVIFPGTFTTISRRLDKEDGSASEFFDHVKHVPLLYIAAFCSGIGGAGMLWLWFRWRANFVWLLNRIFLPGCLNSLAGLISTLVNVYSQQDGKWSVTAWVTAVVTGGCMVITGVLFALYNFWILEKVRRSHGRDMEADQREGEGLVEKIERKAHEPALEPGSVV